MSGPMSSLISAEIIIVVLMLVATVVAILIRRVRLPYTVSLVLVGLLIAAWRPVTVAVTPELILAIFVPPLVFEAAFHLDFHLLRSTLASIVFLAVPGVIVTAILVGGVVALGAGLPVGPAIVFGALISATDPVAVVSLFRALGVPERLGVAVEGESLFNDGTAIVVFHIALIAAISGEFRFVDSLFRFLEVSIGGVVIGLALGWLVARLMARIDDRLIETTLTTLLAYGAYLAAERLQVSGVLSVVAAGMYSGNVGLRGASPTTRIMLFSLWEFLAFLSNSLIFLLIGLNVHISELVANAKPIAVAVAAVLMSRAVVVYGLSWMADVAFRGTRIPFQWRHILFWGGLRGAISLALALSLPLTLTARGTLQVMTFGVLLFTLLAQGTTIQFLVKVLGITSKTEHQLEFERRVGRSFALQAGLKRLTQLREEGLLSEDMRAGLQAHFRAQKEQVMSEISCLFRTHAELERDTLLQARREVLLAERAALDDALRRGVISEPTYDELRRNMDYRLEAVRLIQEHEHGAEES